VNRSVVPNPERIAHHTATVRGTVSARSARNSGTMLSAPNTADTNTSISSGRPKGTNGRARIAGSGGWTL